MAPPPKRREGGGNARRHASRLEVGDEEMYQRVDDVCEPRELGKVASRCGRELVRVPVGAEHVGDTLHEGANIPNRGVDGDAEVGKELPESLNEVACLRAKVLHDTVEHLVVRRVSHVPAVDVGFGGPTEAEIRSGSPPIEARTLG